MIRLARGRPWPGVICHEKPQRSLHQPHMLSWPPLPTMAFHSRSVSAWSSVRIMKLTASFGDEHWTAVEAKEIAAADGELDGQFPALRAGCVSVGDALALPTWLSGR